MRTVCSLWSTVTCPGSAPCALVNSSIIPRIGSRMTVGALCIWQYIKPSACNAVSRLAAFMVMVNTRSLIARSSYSVSLAVVGEGQFLAHLVGWPLDGHANRQPPVAIRTVRGERVDGDDFDGLNAVVLHQR